MKQEIEKEAKEYVNKTTLYGAEKAPIGSGARSYFETELRCFIAGVNSKCSERIKIEYSDQECISFAEWISNNLKWQKKTKRDLWLNNETLKVVTTSELLTIYKKENGK